MNVNEFKKAIAIRTRSRALWTRATHRSRATPDFICIGFYKAGTTSLYDYLDLHPNVIPAWQKEVNYYSVLYDRGEPWYRSHFPTRRALRRANAITGEATPSICQSPVFLDRVRRESPQARLIFVMREPFERTRSLYAMWQGKGTVVHTFEQVIDLADSVRAGATITDPAAVASLAFLEKCTVESLYPTPIQLALDHSDGDLLVLFLETIFSDDGASLEMLSSFLTIPHIPSLTIPHSNVGAYRRSADPSSPTIASMRSRFDESNAELRELLQSPRIITTHPIAWPEWLRSASDPHAVHTP